MCFNKNKNLLPYEKNGCSHNWIHYAGKQCEWDVPYILNSGEIYKKDSNNVCYFYICTICQEIIWSSNKMFDIPHYRGKEVLNKNIRR